MREQAIGSCQVQYLPSPPCIVFCQLLLLNFFPSHPSLSCIAFTLQRVTLASSSFSFLFLRSTLVPGTWDGTSFLVHPFRPPSPPQLLHCISLPNRPTAFRSYRIMHNLSRPCPCSRHNAQCHASLSELSTTSFLVSVISLFILLRRPTSST